MQNGFQNSNEYEIQFSNNQQTQYQENIGNSERELKYKKFYEEFFDSIMSSKDADVIAARKYLTKNINPRKTQHKTVKDFLKELLYILYMRKPIQGYFVEYLNIVSTEKVGWFHYEQYVLIENLVTVLQQSLVSVENQAVLDELLKYTYSYMNKSYETY